MMRLSESVASADSILLDRASGVGGYIASRLRTNWVSVQTDEMFSGITAHGFVVWALGARSSAPRC